MAEEPSPSTPKRKRTEQPPATPIKFSFDPLKTESPDDGSHSPRTCVAHRFRGLALGGGGGGGEPGDVDAADPTRKRRRPSDDATVTAAGLSLAAAGPAPTRLFQPDVAVVSTEYPDAAAAGPPNPRPPRRRRAGTPPLRLKRSPAPAGDAAGPELPPLADPVRAALTWHEDEITIYDPDDADDDGTGVNGVGFKPTPALAHARVMKRRQQMADYSRREASEARARRSQRRRGEAAAAAAASRGAKKTSPPRKVRFMDAENQNMGPLATA